MIKSVLNKKTIIISFILIISIMGYNIYKHFDMIKLWTNYFPDDSELKLISYYSFWYYIMTYEYSGLFIFVIPIFLVINGVYNFFNVYHSGYFQYKLFRTTYKKLFISEIIKSWLLGGFLLPITSILVFIISIYFYPNSQLALEDQVNGLPFLRMPEVIYSNSPIIYFIISTIIMLLFSIVIVNIGNIVSRYLKNFYLVIIGSFLIIVFYETMGAMIIGPLFASILNSNNIANGFSIYNLYFMDSVPSLQWSLIYAITLVIITTLIIYFIYRNKEMVVLNYE